MFPSLAHTVITDGLQKGFTVASLTVKIRHSSWDFILLSVLANNGISSDQNFACGFIAR